MAFVGALNTLTLTKKKELDIRCPTIARSLSCARSFAMSVSERVLVWRERESKLEKAAEEICSSGHPSFFLAALRDGGLLEMSCFSSMVSSMVPLANASWPSHFAFPLWSTVFIFWWFVCFFRAPALIFKNKWTRNIKKQTSCPYSYSRCTAMPCVHVHVASDSWHMYMLVAPRTAGRYWLRCYHPWLSPQVFLGRV